MSYIKPKGWNDINLYTFQNLIPYVLTNHNFTRIQYQNYWIRLCKLLNVPDEVIDNLTKEEFELFCADLEWVHTLPTTINLKCVIDGVEYGFNENATKWMTNEFSDFDVYASEKTEKEIFENLHLIVGIFLRPIVKIPIKKKYFWNKRKYEYKVSKYVVDELDDRAKLFKEKLPCDVAYSLCLFFCLLGIEFTNNSIQSSVQNLLREIQGQ